MYLLSSDIVLQRLFVIGVFFGAELCTLGLGQARVDGGTGSRETAHVSVGGGAIESGRAVCHVVQFQPSTQTGVATHPQLVHLIFLYVMKLVI